MIIACKPHGVNLIGALKFLTETTSSPRKRSMHTCTRPFPSLRAGSGNETTLHVTLKNWEEPGDKAKVTDSGNVFILWF